jgi:capsid assembly protease
MSSQILSETVWALCPQHIGQIETALKECLTISHRATPEAYQAMANGRSGEDNVTTLMNKWAVISLSGPMMKNAGFLEFFGFSSMRKVANAIDRAAANKDVDGIVLVINSPGGSANGIAELGDSIQLAKRYKPVIAQVDGIAASAAYWVASQASEIRMHADDQVGSIGVLNMVFDTEKYYENEGIKAHLITTGEYKAVGAPGVPVTKEQLVPMQETVDFYFAQFKAAVTLGRAMAPSQLDAVANGRMFTADLAIASRLADKVMTLKETLAELSGEKSHAKKNAGLRSASVGKHTSTARARLALLQAM